MSIKEKPSEHEKVKFDFEISEAYNGEWNKT